MTKNSCKITTSTHHTFETSDTPWSDAPRADAKTELAEYVAQHPERVPLSKVVRDVFGGYEKTHAQLARRFFERQETFKINGGPGLQWVEPTPALFTCTAGKQRSESQDGSGGAANTENDAGQAEQNWAKERATATVEQVTQVHADTLKRGLLGELLTERRSTATNVIVQERLRGAGEDYTFRNHATRFNDEDRAREIQRKYDRAWARATARYDKGVLVTLTSDPKRHDSLQAAADALKANFGRLMDWLATTPSGPGHRPDYIAVPEFTDTGVPHLHVVCFGVDWLVSHGKLVDYWSNTRNQGECVYLQMLRNARGRWLQDGLISDGSGDTVSTDVNAPRSRFPARARSIQSYLGKMISTLVAFTTHSVDAFTTSDHAGTRVAPADVVAADGEVRKPVNSEWTPPTRGRPWWKLALYWVLDRQFWTASESLQRRDDSETPDLPPVSRWSTVGAAPRTATPSHVRRTVDRAVRSARVDTAGGSDGASGNESKEDD